MVEKSLVASWVDSDTVLLPISELCLSAPIESMDKQKRVLQSLKDNWLYEPLSVAYVTADEWRANMDNLSEPPECSDKDQKFYRVQMGNNRLRAAIELGYTQISCNVFDSIEDAINFGVQSSKRGRKKWLK